MKKFYEDIKIKIYSKTLTLHLISKHNLSFFQYISYSIKRNQYLTILAINQKQRIIYLGNHRNNVGAAKTNKI